MIRILFICHGNICRSAMAEFICKQLRKDLYCESRAVSYEEEGNDIYPPAKRCLDRHGISYTRHHAKRIQQADYEDFDVIYVMDHSNMRLIRQIIDDKEHKIKMLCPEEIADPWYTGDFEGVFAQLSDGIMNI